MPLGPRLEALVGFFVVGFILGVACGCLLGLAFGVLWAAAPPQQLPQQLGGYPPSGLGCTPQADVLPPLEEIEMPCAPQTRSVETMSQVTYKWWWQQPKFQPLGARDHGAWASNS